jgi:hypothetical protein
VYYYPPYIVFVQRLIPKKLPSIDIQMSTSKNRMRAFRAGRTLIETPEQKESRLAVDRECRKQRLVNLHLKQTNEEKQIHLVSRSQYEVKRLADKRAKENAKERKERLTDKREKEMNRRQNLRARETDAARNTRLECDRDQHR